MSQKNVEVVRRVLTARQDFTTRQEETARQNEIADLVDPAMRLDLSERVFNPAVYEGYEGIVRWRADMGDVWESYRTEPEEFFDGDEVVVVFTRERGRGKGSGVEIDRHIAFLCRLRTGRVSEIRLYLDREQALRDAGLAG
jgi:ketosteroid isomerase-like protein